jgi:hypothetical protein
LTAELVLRDVRVAARVTPEGVALGLEHYGVQVVAIGCEACGDEVDTDSGGYAAKQRGVARSQDDDETLGAYLEALVDERLRRCVDEVL